MAEREVLVDIRRGPARRNAVAHPVYRPEGAPAKVVILSEAKDLQLPQPQVLRYAQDDNSRTATVSDVTPPNACLLSGVS